MGRHPQPALELLFTRGAKLNDRSNRYSMICKTCGETIAKGRTENLKNHVKNCPALTVAERIAAVSHFKTKAQGADKRTAHGNDIAPQPVVMTRGIQHQLPLPVLSDDQNLTALRTLAEVSSGQMDLGENHNDRRAAAPRTGFAAHIGVGVGAQFGAKLPHQEQQAGKIVSPIDDSIDPDALAPLAKRVSEIMDRSGIIKNPLADSSTKETADVVPAAAIHAPVPAADARLDALRLDPQLFTSPATSSKTPKTPASFHSNTLEPVTTSTSANQAVPGTLTLADNGVRFENGEYKTRHARAKFSAERRKEVSEVRAKGACIRCKILRKICSVGDPCDTCRSVVSPRVWKGGCVRTKLQDQLNIYSAGVQVKLAKIKVNSLRQALRLTHHGVMVEACHFADRPFHLKLNVLQTFPAHLYDSNGAVPDARAGRIVMIDDSQQELHNLMESYMRESQPTYIDFESSSFVRTTLKMASELATTTNDDVLQKALELWVLVEILNRERQWVIRVLFPNASTGEPAVYLNNDQCSPDYETICMQLASTVEQKAQTLGLKLLESMQRVLADSKNKVDFSMYLASMILLSSVEKTTWAFKAWCQPNLRHMWPLDAEDKKEPEHYTDQGYGLAQMLRSLLDIRKILPRTSRRETDGMLVTDEVDPMIRRYFESLSLDYALVLQKQQHPSFMPADPRSLELAFCSFLLLPAEQ